MNGTGNRMGWGARLLIALVFILLGAGAAIWGLAHYPPAARVLGVVPAAPQPVITTPKPTVAPPAPAATPAAPDNARIAELKRMVGKKDAKPERSASRGPGNTSAKAE